MEMERRRHLRRTSIFLGPRHTTLFQRCAAKAIDLIIVVAIFLLGKAFWTPAGVLAAAVFCALQDSFGAGQSIGKRIIGLRVIEDHSGFSCTMQASFLRNVPFVTALLFSWSPVLWILLILVTIPMLALESYLIFMLEPGVRLGDVLGNTLVVEYIDDGFSSLPDELRRS